MADPTNDTPDPTAVAALAPAGGAQAPAPPPQAAPTQAAPDAPQPAPSPATANAPQAQPHAAAADTSSQPQDASSGVLSTIEGVPGAIFHQAKDIGRGVVQGALDAVHETSKTIDDVAAAGTKGLKSLGIPDVDLTIDGNGPHVSLDSNPNTDPSAGQSTVPQVNSFKPDTMLGHLAEGSSQFLTGMAMFGGIGREVAAVSGDIAGNLVGKVAGEAAKGGLANAISFNAHEGNLADLLERYPSIAKYASPYLISNPNDSEAEARFKRGLEGLGLGALGEGFFGAIKAFKNLKAGNVDAAVAASDETKAAIEKTTIAHPSPEEEASGAVREATPEELAGSAAPPNDPDATGAGPTPLTQAPTKGASGGPEIFQENKPAPVTQDTLDAFVHKAASNDAISWLPGEQLPDSIQHNWANSTTNDDIKNALNSYETAFDAKAGALDGVQTFKQVASLAKGLGMDPGELLMGMQQTAKDVRGLNVKVAAYGAFVQNQQGQTRRLAQMVTEQTPGVYQSMDNLYREFAKNFNIAHYATNYFKSINSDVARAQGVLRMGFDNVGQQPFTPLSNLDDILRSAKALSLADNTMEGQTAAMKGSFLTRAAENMNSVLVNSLLSLKTGVVKASSDAFKLVLTPAEKALGGVYWAAGGGLKGAAQGGLSGAVAGAKPGLQSAREAFGTYASYGRFLFDALDMAGRAFKAGGQITDAAHGYMVPQGFGDGTVFNNLTNGNQGRALVNGMTHYVTLPSRVVGTLDEFVKNLTYRAEVYRKAARDVAFDPSIADKPGAIEQRMQAAFGPNGEALDPDALQVAREATFSQPPIRDPKDVWMGSQSLTATAMDASAKVPLLRQIQPFMNVPANIARYQWQRTPLLNLLQKQYVNDLMAGGERTSNALSKMTTGGAIMAAGAYLAHGGLVTGTLHPNPIVSRQIEDLTGQRPNSWVITHPDGSKDYVPLMQAGDPLGPMLAAGADLAHIAPYLQDHEYRSFAMATASVIGEQLSQKRYLQGLTNALDAVKSLQDPTLSNPQRVMKFTAGLAAGYVPAMLANEGNDDPYMREINGYLQGMQRKLADAGELDPHRNILGEPVQVPPSIGPNDLSPFQRSTDPDDPVAEELARQLGMGDRPLPRVPFKITLPGGGQTQDLTQLKATKGYFSAYDRLQELTGQPPGKEPMRKAFEDLFNSDAYAHATDGVAQYKGSRRELIDRVFGAYQLAGKAAFIKEDEANGGTIVQRAIEDAQNRAAAMRSNILPHPELVQKNALREAITAPQQ